MSAIKSGDLVMQVHSCCPKFLGRIFVVSEVSVQTFTCKRCHPKPRTITVGYTLNIAAAPIEWLKRIPPLDEMERDQLVKELTV
jgi:hypothetical protein